MKDVCQLLRGGEENEVGGRRPRLLTKNVSYNHRTFREVSCDLSLFQAGVLGSIWSLESTWTRI